MRILVQASFPLGVRPLLRQRGGVVRMLRMSVLHIWLTHFLRSASCLLPAILKLTNHFPAWFAQTYLLSVAYTLSAFICLQAYCCRTQQLLHVLVAVSELQIQHVN